MPTELIIALVVIGILLIVGTAYSIQIMEKNSREKRRLMFSLRERAESFKVLLESFPQGFLTPDLQILMCKCLVDILEQLVRIDKVNRNKHTQSISQVNSHLQQLKANPAMGTYQSLGDPKHVQQVQKLLGNLYNFIVKLRQAKKITEDEAVSYTHQVRHLTVLSALDAYRFAQQAAMKDGKVRLAVHYQTVSIDKMLKENSDGYFNDRIVGYQEQLVELEKALLEQEKSTKPEVAAENSEEWDKFEDQYQQEQHWQKKAIYD
jgi:hypothetical protein